MITEYPQVHARSAEAQDVTAVMETLTGAFRHDPLWALAFPDPNRRIAQLAAMWHPYVTSALRYPWLLVTENIEAAAVWIPPGGTELTSGEQEDLEPLLTRTAGREAARRVLGMARRFADVFPDEPCFYLTLLGTRTDCRGHGWGMGLLAESLERIDALGAPAYLESSNPANLERYRSVGFIPRTDITFGSDLVATTMWRPGR